MPMGKYLDGTGSASFPALLIIISSIIICSAACIIAVAIERRRARKLMGRMMHMLDEAANGTFTVSQIDESMLSSLEFKLSHYIHATETSTKKLAQEKEIIKSLISDISHQTKTPIASLLLYCELLKEQDLDKEAASYVDALYAQTHKLHFLVSSLIKMSRLESGTIRLAPEHAEVMPLLAKAHGQFERKAMDKGIAFTVIPPEPGQTPKAFYDEKWMLEALGNIIDNAIKYTKSGAITLKATSFSFFCRIEVTDTGIGIAEEEQAQVFTRFYRSKDVSSEDGIGIGLSLAREIITQGGGYIKLTSAPGKGSAFAIFLPMEPPFFQN